MATAMPLKEDPNELMSCPYNKAHQIIRSRMQTHLAKCKKNYSDKDYLECPYNSVHMIPGAEFMHHVENCKDRDKLDCFIFNKDVCDFNKFPLPNIQVEAEENWDNVNVPSYDATANCLSKPVLRNINLLSAAKRRDFRVEERHRHQHLENGTVEISKAPKESAVDYAKRQSKTEKIPEEIIDQNDPYGVKSLANRITEGGISIHEANPNLQPQLHGAAEIKREGEWSKIQTRARGRGRGILKPSN